MKEQHRAARSFVAEEALAGVAARVDVVEPEDAVAFRRPCLLACDVRRRVARILQCLWPIWFAQKNIFPFQQEPQPPTPSSS